MNKKSLIKNPDIVERTEDKEALLFDPADGNMLCINATGMFIWNRCDGKHDLKDIAKLISDQYEVSEEKSREDCRRFIKELEESGFIGYKV